MLLPSTRPQLRKFLRGFEPLPALLRLQCWVRRRASLSEMPELISCAAYWKYYGQKKDAVLPHRHDICRGCIV